MAFDTLIVLIDEFQPGRPAIPFTLPSPRLGGANRLPP